MNLNGKELNSRIAVTTQADGTLQYELRRGAPPRNTFFPQGTFGLAIETLIPELTETQDGLAVLADAELGHAHLEDIVLIIPSSEDATRRILKPIGRSQTYLKPLDLDGTTPLKKLLLTDKTKRKTNVQLLEQLASLAHNRLAGPANNLYRYAAVRPTEPWYLSKHVTHDPETTEARQAYLDDYVFSSLEEEEAQIIKGVFGFRQTNPDAGPLPAIPTPIQKVTRQLGVSLSNKKRKRLIDKMVNLSTFPDMQVVVGSLTDKSSNLLGYGRTQFGSYLGYECPSQLSLAAGSPQVLKVAIKRNAKHIRVETILREKVAANVRRLRGELESIYEVLVESGVTPPEKLEHVDQILQRVQDRRQARPMLRGRWR